MSTTTATSESEIWKGHPSHATLFGLHLLCWLFCWLVVPIFISLWKIIETRHNQIEITDERIRLTQGVFSRRTEELELYRVRDMAFVQPFLLRLFGKGHIRLTTTDASAPELTLPGVPADEDLRSRLRTAIEKCRDRKRARVAELGGVVDADGPDHAV